MAPCNTQNTPFTPLFRKIPFYHHLTTREEEPPAESHTVLLVVIFVVVVLAFIFLCIMSFAPWRKIKRAQYGQVNQDEEHELQEDAHQDWPLIVDTHPVSPPRPRLEEQIRKLWESSRGKQRSPKQAANNRDSMDLADFDDVSLATPWKKGEAYDENTNYKDDVEDKERKWVKQPVKGQGANHKSSDENMSNNLTNSKKLA